jgi:hypothetical protein
MKTDISTPISRISGTMFLAAVLLASGVGPRVCPAVPPREQWVASASGGQDGEFPARAAIDGRYDTRWSSPFEDGHDLTIDLGTEVEVAGVIISWETAYASVYRVETSLDGRAWRIARQVESGDGRTDRLYFPCATARYVRVVAERRATGWGASIWELDILSPDKVPQIVGETRFPIGEISARWVPDRPTAALEFEFPAPESIGGLNVRWKRHAQRDLRWSVADDAGTWRLLGIARESEGEFDAIPHELLHIRRAKLEMHAQHPDDLRIDAIEFRGPGEERTPLALYEIAASKAPTGWYPESLRRRQVYWTVIGLPDSPHEALLDEYGNLEPGSKGPTLMPYLRLDGRLLSPLDATSITQALVEGYLPLPYVEWTTTDARVRVEALADRIDGRDVVPVRYTISAASDRPFDGEFALLLRPIQINPKWQHGGVSPLHDVRIEQTPTATRVHAGDWSYTLVPPADRAMAVPFAGNDAVELVARARWNGVAGATCRDGMLSAATCHKLSLAAGTSTAIVLIVSGKGEPPAAMNHEEFARRYDAARQIWDNNIRKADIELGDREVTDTLYAQAGYILVNRDGRALQPGSRNYDRVWIRDGALTASALLRLGLTDAALDYVDWYARAIREDGLVPPILHSDGSVYEGFGSNLEYDAQGQFIFIVAEAFRFSNDDAFLSRHYPAIVRVMRAMQTLRERTLQHDYAADDPRRERYRGLLPASISHEGYSTPHHAYWDNYWALRGWRDGAELARAMGDRDIAAWAEDQYALLADAVRESIRRTIRECGIDFIPGSAERGDEDATSASIAFFPCEVAEDLFPPEVVKNTYDKYLAYVARRDSPDASWLYTPYEARNIAALQVMARIEDARALHDRLLRDRRPPGWRHFAEVVAGDYRRGVYIGDMPHTWAGADYVVSARTMLAREVGEDLRLLEGAPGAWWRETGLRLSRLPSRFGPFDLSIEPTAGGYALRIRAPPRLRGCLRVYWPADATPVSIEVDGEPIDTQNLRDGFFEWCKAGARR